MKETAGKSPRIPRISPGKWIAAVAVAALALAVARRRAGGDPGRMAEALTDMVLLACLFLVPFIVMGAWWSRDRRRRVDGAPGEI